MTLNCAEENLMWSKIIDLDFQVYKKYFRFPEHFVTYMFGELKKRL